MPLLAEKLVPNSEKQIHKSFTKTLDFKGEQQNYIYYNSIQNRKEKTNDNRYNASLTYTKQTIHQKVTRE